MLIYSVPHLWNTQLVQCSYMYMYLIPPAMVFWLHPLHTNSVWCRWWRWGLAAGVGGWNRVCPLEVQLVVQASKKLLHKSCCLCIMKWHTLELIMSGGYIYQSWPAITILHPWHVKLYSGNVGIIWTSCIAILVCNCEGTGVEIIIFMVDTPLARKTSSWSIQSSFKAAFGFSFRSNATTYLAKAAGSASHLHTSTHI